ncbi:MAG: PadR family transcriptional regulator [Candidatus Omnitrophica bacterium]|nr:PadR family transcriptional regulator [Candidatus Omnitrophota bacterium]
MIQKLIILGLLKEHYSSGYDIKKFIEKKLDTFSQLDTQSIYYPLKKMEKEGLIKKSELSGQTHLKKYMYSLTAKGEKEFVYLCNQALLSNKRPFIDIDIPLYFLPHLNKRDVLARLRLRKRVLQKVKAWLALKVADTKEFLPYQTLLLKHHLNLLGAEKKFIEEFAEFVKQH